MASGRWGNKIKPTGGYELALWYFMRVSGLVLVFLACGHLFIMHILNNVETINYAFVASRWTAPKTGFVWRLWDFMMISLAVIHGFNGLRQVLYEYVSRPGRRVAVGTAIWMAAGSLILLGSYAIFTFEPDLDYIKEHPLKNKTPVRAAPGPGVAAQLRPVVR